MEREGYRKEFRRKGGEGNRDRSRERERERGVRDGEREVRDGEREKQASPVPVSPGR